MKQQTALITLSLLVLPAIALADSHETTVAEVKKTIEQSMAASRETRSDDPTSISKHGSHEFWSSGGLLNSKGPREDPQEFEVFNLYPKHIEVIPLAEGVAAAMYYAEGSMQPKGLPLVSDYRTRVLVVLVKEDGVWKQRAGHWSPLRGGSGTSQTVD